LYRLPGITEHCIFHGITFKQDNKPLNIKDKKGLITIELGVGEFANIVSLQLLSQYSKRNNSGERFFGVVR
jgi:hypothetical protein